MAEHYRIIAISSYYTESEERIFNVLRGIARALLGKSKFIKSTFYQNAKTGLFNTLPTILTFYTGNIYFLIDISP